MTMQDDLDDILRQLVAANVRRYQELVANEVLAQRRALLEKLVANGQRALEVLDAQHSGGRS